jgi:phosphoglycolate phosphatase-like HAD superfamily hydrolase
MIIGDSLLDVACARAHGVRSLAVATGRTSASALAAAGADWVIADLHAADQCHAVFA